MLFCVCSRYQSVIYNWRKKNKKTMFLQPTTTHPKITLLRIMIPLITLLIVCSFAGKTPLCTSIIADVITVQRVLQSQEFNVITKTKYFHSLCLTLPCSLSNLCVCLPVSLYICISDPPLISVSSFSPNTVFFSFVLSILRCCNLHI